MTKDQIKDKLSNSDDCLVRNIVIDNYNIDIVYIDGVISSDILNMNVIKPLMQYLNQISQEKKATTKTAQFLIQSKLSKNNNSVDNQQVSKSESLQLVQALSKSVLPITNITVSSEITTCANNLLFGFACIIVNGCEQAISVDVRGLQMRSIGESSENVIKGSKDCFVESCKLNVALIRAHYPSVLLKTQEIDVGKTMKTKVVLAYNNQVVDKDIVKALTKKLEKFDKNGIFGSAELEDHLSRHKNKVFPEMTYTERPDKIAASINKGKIAIIIDNLPFVYIVPTTFAMTMQAVEDYSRNYIVASFTRCLRYVAFFISVILPGLYIAVMMFHHEMIPKELALSLIASKEGVAFPTPFEVFFMLISFEILVEAGLRMPKAIGQAVSIVGALVVGQAAVSANFISASVIVIVALSAIAGFTIPDQDIGNAIKLWRLFLAVLASVLGLYGLVLGLIIMGSMMARMEFFQESFMYPFVNSGGKWLKKDTLIRTD